MKVFALVGKSGTGKSYHSMNLCNDLNIASMIDDGLFIYKNRVISGNSAKKENTKIGAVKTALFYNDEHAKSVIESIKKVSPDSILILGTSSGMVDKIVKRLELPKIQRYIRIEDIATSEEIETARMQRFQLGKHVIPAPTFQIKHAFAGYFINPLKIFKGAANKVTGKVPANERTVVRPTYSYLGKYYVAPNAIKGIIKCAARGLDCVNKVIKVSENGNPEAMEVSVVIVAKAKEKMWKHILKFQDDIKQEIEKMTAFNVIHVDIEIKTVMFEKI